MGVSQRLVPTNSAQPTKDASPRFIPAKDVSGNTITLPYKSGTAIATGDAVIYSSGGSTPIGGLTDGQTYYAIVVGTGTFGAQQIRLATTRDRAVSGLAITLNAALATGTAHSLVPSGVLPAPDPRTTNPQTAQLTNRTGFSGVAVTATNSDSINAIGISAGVSADRRRQRSGTVSVITVTTTASIGATAKVNCASETDCYDQRRRRQPRPVRRRPRGQQLPPARHRSRGGRGRLRGSRRRCRCGRHRHHHLREHRRRRSRQRPRRHRHRRRRQGVVRLGGRRRRPSARDAGLAGAVGVTVLDLTTTATTGTRRHSQGGEQLLVLADDATELVLVAASLGAGFWAGIGAGVSVAVVTKTTDAHLGANNVVVVLGAGCTAAGISDGTSTPAGGFGAKGAFHGLAVQANSSEELFGLTAGIAGGFVGVAGGIGVNIFTVVVKAFIAGGTTVNQGHLGHHRGRRPRASPSSSPPPTCSRRSPSRWPRRGAAGIAGGVDVGVANITVQAYLGVGSDVWANGTVELNALATKRVQTYAVSLGGGVVGVAGSVSVWTVGTAATNTYQSAVSGPDRGVWSSATTYEAGDIVSVSGVRYFSRSRNVGKNPTTNPSVWIPRAWPPASPTRRATSSPPVAARMPPSGAPWATTRPPRAATGPQ